MPVVAYRGSLLLQQRLGRGGRAFDLMAASSLVPGLDESPCRALLHGTPAALLLASPVATEDRWGRPLSGPPAHVVLPLPHPRLRPGGGRRNRRQAAGGRPRRARDDVRGGSAGARPRQPGRAPPGREAARPDRRRGDAARAGRSSREYPGEAAPAVRAGPEPGLRAYAADEQPSRVVPVGCRRAGRPSGPGRRPLARLLGVSPGAGCYRRPWDTPGRATRRGPAGAGIVDKEGELDMLWPPVRCGGKDRGMPPVERLDTQLGLLLVIGVLSIVIALLVIVPALLLRMLAGVGAAVLGGTAASAI